jgi:hypothetical protein
MVVATIWFVPSGPQQWMCAAVSGVVKLENVTLAARGDGGWPFAPHELDLSESKGTGTTAPTNVPLAGLGNLQVPKAMIQ